MNEFATAEFKALLDSMPRSRVSSPTNTIAHIFRHEHKENFISDWLAFLLNPDEDHRPAGWQSYDGGPGGICIRGRDGRRRVKNFWCDDLAEKQTHGCACFFLRTTSG